MLNLVCLDLHAPYLLILPIMCQDSNYCHCHCGPCTIFSVEILLWASSISKESLLIVLSVIFINAASFSFLLLHPSYFYIIKASFHLITSLNFVICPRRASFWCSCILVFGGLINVGSAALTRNSIDAIFVTLII